MHQGRKDSINHIRLLAGTTLASVELTPNGGRLSSVMNDQSLNLWRQIESGRHFGKKRQWPIESKRPAKAAND